MPCGLADLEVLGTVGGELWRGLGGVLKASEASFSFSVDD